MATPTKKIFSPRKLIVAACLLFILSFANYAYATGFDVYAFFNPKETIILQDIPWPDTNRDVQYPEVAFITIVGVQGGSFYDAGNIVLDLKIDPKVTSSTDKDKPAYFLYDLTANGLDLTNLYVALFFGGGGNINWKGIYSALATADPEQIAAAFNNLRNAIPIASIIDRSYTNPQSIEVRVDNHKRCAVIAVVSWNYNKKWNDLKFTLQKKAGCDPAAILKQPEVKIKLNIDNVQLIRENVEKFLAQNPEKNFSNFRGADPGLFVVKGTQKLGAAENRTYDKIIQIKIAQANGTIPEPTGSTPASLDWLEVKAADIYNRYLGNQAFDCVRFLNANFFEGYDWKGVVFRGQCTQVVFNTVYRQMRFDTGNYCPYGNWYYNYATATIWHEPLHSAQFYITDVLQKEGVKPLPFYDSDSGFLVAADSDLNTKPDYFRFAWDHKDRGYFNPVGWNPKRILEQLFTGKLEWGDRKKHPNIYNGIFYLRLDDKFTPDELEDIFVNGKGSSWPIDTFPVIPDDFVRDTTKLELIGVYLVGPAGGPSLKFFRPLYSETGSAHVVLPVPRSIHVPLIEISPETRPAYEDVNGRYRRCRYWLKVNACKMKNAELYHEMLTSSNWGKFFRLYAFFKLRYEIKPYEYDATVFAITKGEGFINWR